MIKETIGDVLNTSSDLICHQTNCRGVMGAGVAKQIRDKLLTKEQFKQYRKRCDREGSSNLGTLQILQCKNKSIVNMFAQVDCDESVRQTNYTALRLCFEKLEMLCRKNHLTAAIPGYIGCGLAGGDWNYVLNDIIKPIFENSEAELEILYWEE